MKISIRPLSFYVIIINVVISLLTKNKMKDYLQLIQKPPVYLINLPQKTDRIYLDTFYKNGYIFNPPKLKGCSHILEHYLVGSINSKYAQDYFKINGRIDNEFINFSFISDKNKILSDLENFLLGIYKPDFSNNKLFQYELKSIENELSEKSHKIRIQILNQVSKKLFLGECPYAKTDINKIKDLQKFNLNNIKKFYNEQLIISEPIFCIGGHDLNKKIIGNILSIINEFSIKNNTKLFKSIPFPKCKLPSFSVKEVKNENIKEGIYSIYILPGFSIQENNLLQRLALNILLRIFRGTSEYGLFLKLREEGIYSFECMNIAGQKTGTISLFSFSNNEQILKLAKIIKEHIDKYKKESIDKEFLKRIIEERKENQKMIWLSNDAKYNWITDDLKNCQPVTDIKLYSNTLNKITPFLLKNLTNQVFNWEKLNLFFAHNGQEKIKINEFKKVFIEK